MDIIDIALAKNFAKKMAAGFTNVEVDGMTINFTLIDGSTVSLTVPTPADGVSVTDLEIDENGDLICTMSDGTEINAGKALPQKGVDYFTTEEIEEIKEEISTELQEEIDLLNSNFEPKTIIPSDNIKVTDSASGRIKNFTLKGKTYQNQYTGKNKMNYMNNIKARNTGGTWNENVYTYNGVTYTIQEDESVIANGTASGASYLKLTSALDLISSESYILTGCPAGGGVSKYSIRLYTDSNYVSETGNGLSFNFDSQDVVRINVSNGTTINNLKFEPMIRLANITDDTYEPYVGGTVSPNPDYTQPLNNIEGNVVIESNNENFFNKDTVTLGYRIQ